MQATGPAGARSGAGSTPWTWVGGIVAGTLALGALILTQVGDPKYVFTGFAMLAFGILVLLVGNLRVVSLHVLLFFAPFTLRLTLAPMPHMGGAGALYIEAVDPFILVLCFYQLRERIKGLRSAYPIPPALWLWVGMIALGVGTVVFGHLRSLAILEIVRMSKLLLMSVVLINEIVTQRQFKAAIVTLLLGVILEAGIALAQNLMGHQLGLSFLGEARQKDVEILGMTSLESGEFVYRAGGLLGHANLFAAYLALFLGIAIALVLTSSSHLLKAISFIALALGTPALVLTLSRAGWIDFTAAFAIAVALGAWNAISRRRYVFSRVAVVVGVTIVGIAMSPIIIKRISDADPTSVEYRLKWIRIARDMVEDHPLFGVGLNAYVFTQLPYGQFKTPEDMTNFYGANWPVVHNNWLIVWSEQGTVGMILWIAFHIAVILAAARNLRIRDPVLHAIGVGLLAGFVAIMVDGMASFFVRQEAPARMFWIATALILALDRWRRSSEEERPAPVPEMPRHARLPALESARPTGRWLPARTSLLQ